MVALIRKLRVLRSSRARLSSNRNQMSDPQETTLVGTMRWLPKSSNAHFSATGSITTIPASVVTQRRSRTTVSWVKRLGTIAPPLASPSLLGASRVQAATTTVPRMSRTQRLPCRERIAILGDDLPDALALPSRAGVEAVGGKGFDFETDVAEGGLGCVERRFDLIGVDPESQGHRDRGRIPELEVFVTVGHCSVTAQGHVAARPVCIDAVGVTFEDVEAGEEGGIVERAGQLADATALGEGHSAVDEIGRHLEAVRFIGLTHEAPKREQLPPTQRHPVEA